jgi:AraC family transcriptional regulator
VDDAMHSRYPRVDALQRKNILPPSSPLPILEEHAKVHMYEKSSIETAIEGYICTPAISAGIEHYRWDRPSESDYLIPEYAIFRTLGPTRSPSRSRVSSTSRSRWSAGFEGLGLWPGATPLHFATSQLDLRVLFCRFSLPRLQTLTGFGKAWAITDHQRCFELRNQRIDRAALHLAEEVLAPGFSPELIVEGVGMPMAVEVARHFQLQCRAPPAKGRLSSLQMRRITEFMSDGTKGCPTITELANLCGISGRHLMRAFKQTTGRTVAHYFEQLRSERAKDLVSLGVPLKELAARLGFSSPSRLSLAFRKATGMTPTSYSRIATS